MAHFVVGIEAALGGDWGKLIVDPPHERIPSLGLQPRRGQVSLRANQGFLGAL
jgi:hypothetical protein